MGSTGRADARPNDSFRSLLLHHLALLRAAGRLDRDPEALALEQRFLAERRRRTQQDLDRRIGVIIAHEPDLAPQLEPIREDPVAPHPEIAAVTNDARGIVRPLRRRLLVIATLQVAVAWRPIVGCIDRVMAGSRAESIAIVEHYRDGAQLPEAYWLNEILQQTLDDLWTDWARLFEEQQ